MHNLPKPLRRNDRAGTLKQLSVPVREFDGRIPLAALANDLVIDIPHSEFLIKNDTLQLLLNDTPYGSIITVDVDYNGNENTLFTLSIAKDEFPAVGLEIEYLIDYIAESSSAHIITRSDLPVKVILDREAPGGHELPLLSFTQEQTSGITLEDLTNGELRVLTAHWSKRMKGDEITPSVKVFGSADSGLIPEDTIIVDDPDAALYLVFKQARLAALGNAVLDFSYQLKDRLGNISELAPPTTIQVILDNPPTGLLAPLVPANDDGLITEADAKEGVEVQIPEYQGAAAGQRIYLNWGDRNLYAGTLRDEDIGQTPMVSFYLPFDTVFYAGNQPGLKVTYEVFIGQTLAATSPVATVAVDLTTPGGIDPDPGTPEHENLRPLLVTSDSGAQNSIPPVDYDGGKNASALIPRLGVDGDVVWETGDIVHLIWKDKREQVAVINAANMGSDLTVTVSGTNLIQPGGVGEIDVAYSISRPLDNAQPDPNYGVATAFPITVTVFSEAELPGGSNDPLVEAIFLSETADHSLYRALIIADNGTPVQVPIPTNIAVGDRVSLRFIGIDSFSDLGAPELGPETEYSVTNREITAAEMNAGFCAFHIPIETLFHVCRNGSLTRYSFTNSLNLTNNSIPHLISIYISGAGLSCEYPIP